MAEISQAHALRAMQILRAYTANLSGENGSEMVDEIAALDWLKARSMDLLHDAKFPDLPADQILDPDEHTLLEVVEAALGAD